MSFIADALREQLTHEGVLDVLPSNKIVTIGNLPDTNSAKITNEDVTVETAVDYSSVLELMKVRDELESLSNSLTTESAGIFLSNVKDFFKETILNIKVKLSSIFKDQNITDVFHNTRINDLKNLNRNINNISAGKFSTVEDMELPVMMGMKANYTQTVFELKNLIALFKDTTTHVKELNKLLSTLIYDTNDIRLSSNPKIFANSDDILRIKQKTTSIINELTEIRKPRDIKKVSEVFNNLGSIKDINASYINLYNENIKFNFTEYVNSINTLSNLLTTWIDTINDRKSEVKYSTNVIYVVQNNVDAMAAITTNLGIYLAFVNQTSGFFITNVKEINNKI